MTREKRSEDSVKERWLSLPPHVMDLIFQEVRIAGIRQMRLVCKAWRNACTDYRGPFPELMDTAKNDLLDVQRVLPGLSEIRIYSSADHCPVMELSGFSQLSYLAMHSQSLVQPKPAFDFALLPTSLKELMMNEFNVMPSSIEHIKCTNLRHLSFRTTSNSHSEVVSLLQHLPLLQDLMLGCHEKDDKTHYGFRNLLGLKSLTKLYLPGETFLGSSDMPLRPLPLRELELAWLKMSESWACQMSAVFQHLSRLELTFCELKAEDLPIPPLASTLRCFTMYQSAEELLSLACPTLQTLTYKPRNPGGQGNFSSAHISTLTALTSLQLEEVHASSGADVGVLRQLGLLQLRLAECSGMAEALIVQGALPALQKLHLEESGYLWDFRHIMSDLGSQAALKQIQPLRQATFALPSLLELSGLSRIFLLEMPETWVLCSSRQPYGLLSEDQAVQSQQVWRKIA